MANLVPNDWYHHLRMHVGWPLHKNTLEQEDDECIDTFLDKVYAACHHSVADEIKTCETYKVFLC